MKTGDELEDRAHTEVTGLRKFGVEIRTKNPLLQRFREMERERDAGSRE